MSSTNKTTYYELSQYVGSDKPTYLGDYNSDMLKIDTGLHAAADAADTAVTTANAANSAATSASTTASTALSTANTASTTASQAQTTAETALTNAGAAQTAASNAETAARANTITNLAPAYDPSLTYDVDDLVTYIDAQGSGKMYKCVVAVTTPESFNINKWDDVTASEAFDANIILISTVIADGVKSWANLLNELLANKLDSISDSAFIKIDHNYFRLNAHDDFNANFNSWSSTATTAYFTNLGYTANNGFRNSASLTSSGFTISDTSNSIPASGTTIYLFS